MLFLVDGKHPLSEVRSLALQAGTLTPDLEDLVQLGLVGLDIHSEWPPHASPSRKGGFDSSGLSTRAGVLTLSRTRPPDTAEGNVLRVRDLLLDSLRVDAPLFAAVTVVRVRQAQTRKELIDFVWASRVARCPAFKRLVNCWAWAIRRSVSVPNRSRTPTGATTLVASSLRRLVASGAHATC
jgi:hypothetical protein